MGLDEKNPWSKGEQVGDPHFKNNEEASSMDDEFIESENENGELDQKESNLCVEESFYTKWERKSSRNVGKACDYDVMEYCAIKKETNDVNEELNCSYESPIKTEIIKQDEVHIKHEDGNEDRPNEKITEFRKETVMHQCPECPYSTSYKYHLKRHSVKHKKRDETDWYSCKQCLYKTYREWDLKHHTEIHNNILLKCSKCSYETLRSSELKKHQIEHDPNIQWLHCPECSFKTHLQSYFRKHSLVHKSGAFKCTNCLYRAKTKNRLTVHQAKHESMDKWHSCPVCPFKSYSKSIFKTHCLRRHNIDPNNPHQIVIFECPECPYESGYIRNVKLHQLIHDPSNWFHCPECAYKTPRKSCLKQHQVRHHGENAESWHMCLKCSYKTTRKYDLQKHILSQHKSADEIEWFECSQCSFKTVYIRSLKRHQLKHMK